MTVNSPAAPLSLESGVFNDGQVRKQVLPEAECIFEDSGGRRAHSRKVDVPRAATVSVVLHAGTQGRFWKGVDRNVLTGGCNHSTYTNRGAPSVDSADEIGLRLDPAAKGDRNAVDAIRILRKIRPEPVMKMPRRHREVQLPARKLRRSVIVDKGRELAPALKKRCLVCPTIKLWWSLLGYSGVGMRISTDFLSDSATSSLRAVGRSTSSISRQYSSGAHPTGSNL